MDRFISSCLRRKVARLDLNGILPDADESPVGTSSLDRLQHPAAKAAALIPDLASLGLEETPPQKPKPREQLGNRPAAVVPSYDVHTGTPASRTDLVPVPRGGVQSIFCIGCGNQSVLNGATLHECPACDEGDFCSGGCWDAVAGECKYCTGEKKVVVPKAHKVPRNEAWTHEYDIVLLELIPDHRTDRGISWGQIVPEMNTRCPRPDGTPWKYTDLQCRWTTTDAPHFGLLSRTDDDLNITETIEDVVARRLEPIVDMAGIRFRRSRLHPRTPMSRPSFAAVFSEPGGDGEWNIPDRYSLKGCSAQLKAMKLEALRRQMVHGSFLSVWQLAKPLLDEFIPEASRDKTPSNFTVQEKQEMLRQFYHRYDICMDWYEPVAGRDAIKAKVDTAKDILSANIRHRKPALEKELSKHNPNLKYDVFEQGKKNLQLPAAQKLLAEIDTFRDGSRSFVDFKDTVEDGVKALAEELPLFEAFECFEDICRLTEEKLNDNNHRTMNMGQFIRSLEVLIMGGKCATCLKSLLDWSLEEWGCMNLDHGPLGDDRRKPADYEKPIKIAQKKGAVALAKAIAEKELVPACDRCHPRNETAEYSKGSPVCLLPGPRPPRQDRLTPADVIVGREEPLRDMEEWNDMTPSERRKFLLPFVFEAFWMELQLSGVFGKWAVDVATADEMRVIFLAFLGRDWDSFCRWDAAFHNFGKDKNRHQKASQVAMYVVYSLCNWDADDGSSDEDAALWGLAPQHYFSIEGDHYGGWNCEPSNLKGRNNIFMLGEIVSFVWPLRGTTHKKRTANQVEDKKPRQADYMVERDLVARSVQNYSETRARLMRNGGN